MPYRLDIPGQITEFQLRAIEAVAALVPDGGCVVEVGSLFGLSSWAWAKSVPPNATVHCVDPWEGNEGVRQLEEVHGVKYGIEQFREYLADCDNIVPIKAYSPEDVQDWSSPVDLYYEDAVHNDPVLSRNIDFWTAKLTPNGIVCGDDYRPRFPDVRAAAEAQARRLGRKLWVVDFFWCVLPDPVAVPAAAAVAEILAGFAEEVAQARLKMPQKIVVGPLVPLPSTLSDPAPRRIRLVNDGPSPWPAEAAGELRMACEILTAEGTLVARQEHGLGLEQLVYDAPVDMAVMLPFGQGLPHRAKVRFTLLAPEGEAYRPAPFEQAVLIAAAEPPAFNIGDILRFGQGGGGDLLLGDGWNAAERAHRWSKGVQAEIQIDLPAAIPSRGWLNLKLRPFLAGGVTTQRLTIMAGGVEIFAVGLGGPASLSVPVDLAAAGGRLAVRMIFPDACRPSDMLPGNADRRMLAFALEALALTDHPLTL
ncbi:hypothetical protein FHS79_002488 [Polymorphobacter multimanifer]|uniref:Class I SAM-dependent methyltransferase n=1 Tax=Polymorphobacter multimanifer TaxID=1070431 RepID=A0A841LBF3_9SPHN|nr:hypothetical protein [Polymorphobacter multimanifer]